MQGLAQRLDLQSPVDKKKFLHEMFGLITPMSSVSLQQHYLDVLADHLHMTREILWSQFKQMKRQQPRRMHQQEETSAGGFKP